jgi:hypothetical protein
MSVQKPVRILYQAKNNTTGLADVKAQCYLNGVAKAVGVGALALTEVDATNSPGLYELLIPAATLTTWGVVAGVNNTIEGYIDSASKSAKAPFREEVTIANLDDIDTAVAAVKADTAAIKVDLESGADSLATILSAVQAIQNNAGFSIPVPAQLVKPSAGSNTYRIPLTIYNEKNQLLDPDSNSIVVTLVNSAGTDRGSYMTGYLLGSAPAVRDSLGQYHIDLAIPSTATEEELIFDFAYAIGGAATARKSSTVVTNNVQADGFALQSTLLAVQTTVNSTDAVVTSATYGNAAIKTAVDAIQTDITSNVEGSGFIVGTDSLHAISAYMMANLFIGGRAV